MFFKAKLVILQVSLKQYLLCLPFSCVPNHKCVVLVTDPRRASFETAMGAFCTDPRSADITSKSQFTCCHNEHVEEPKDCSNYVRDGFSCVQPNQCVDDQLNHITVNQPQSSESKN
jgi:hypothetical protein